MQEQTYKVKVEFENPVDGVKVLMLKGEKGDKGDPAGVVNEHSASTTDAYSANYVNNTIYTKTEVDGKVSGVYHYKGSVATYEDLPSSDLTVGDVYNVETDGKNYAWTGSDWDSLGGTVDFSSYYTKNETDGLLNAKANTADLATVATSGDFDDLSNQPDAAVMGSTLSTPSNVAYVATENIQDGAVTAEKASFTNYSTTEQVVGTWIDGKPLYRVSLAGTVPNTVSTSTVSVIGHIDNVDTVRMIEAWAKRADYWTSMNFTYGTLQSAVQLSGRAGGGIAIGDITLLTDVGYANAPYNITIEYTKTTD